MAELTYRDAVARGIAQEMRRDDRVVLIGEDIAGELPPPASAFTEVWADGGSSWRN